MHGIVKSLVSVLGLSESEVGVGAMRLVTWNIKRSEAAFGYALDVLKADAIFFQESKGLPAGSQLVGVHRNINERRAKRNWGNTSAVIPPLEIADVELDTSYWGSLIASVVKDPSGARLGVINMYGLFERPSATSRGGVVNPGLHRRVSDITFWLHTQHGPEVDAFLLLGDWNQHRVMDVKFRSNHQSNSASNFFDRLLGLGLTDLVDLHYENAPQTYRAVRGNYPWQLDHVYVSTSSRADFGKPWVDDSPEADSISDHRPIVFDYLPSQKPANEEK